MIGVVLFVHRQDYGERVTQREGERTHSGVVAQ